MGCVTGHRTGGCTDLLSEASGGTVTEVEVATHGATEGKSVGDERVDLPQTPTYGDVITLKIC